MTEIVDVTNFPDFDIYWPNGCCVTLALLNSNIDGSHSAAGFLTQHYDFLGIVLVFWSYVQ